MSDEYTSRAAGRDVISEIIEMLESQLSDEFLVPAWEKTEYELGFQKALNMVRGYHESITGRR